MTYLITGATGDIGSKVVQLLLERGEHRESSCATPRRPARNSETWSIYSSAISQTPRR
jgi:uncharacterized protein YbjT (DUF2867 family)